MSSTEYGKGNKTGREIEVDHYRWTFWNHANNIKIKHLEKFFKKNIESGNASKRFMLHYTTKNELFCLPLKLNGIQRWTIWFSTLFSNQAKYITSCLKQYNAYQLENFNGNHKKAIIALDMYEEHYGVSLWSVYSRIKTLCSSGEKKAASEFLFTLTENKYLKQMCDRFFAKCQTENAEKFRVKLQGDLREYRNGGNNENANILSFLLIHPSYDQERNPLDALSIISSLSIFDQYNYHKLVLAEILSNCNDETKKLIKDYLTKLSQIIDDKDITSSLKRANQETEYTSEQIEVLKLYTEGKYDTCIGQILCMLNVGSSGIEFIEVLAKCLIRCKSKPDAQDNDKNKLISLFKNALSVDKKCSEHVQEIENILLKNYPDQWTIPVYSQLCYIFKNVSCDKLNVAARFNYLSGQPVTPRVVRIATSNEKMKTDSLNATIRYAREKNVSINAPVHRIAKYEIVRHLENNDCTGIEETITKAQSLKHDFLPYELEELMVDYYLCNGEAIKALNIIADCCIDNIECYRCFSLKGLVPYFSEPAISKSIYKPIILHIYNKKICNEYSDELKYSYDDYMRSHGEHLPSVVYKSKTLSKHDKYFLENVCTIATMSISSGFENSIGLHSERIRILDLVISENIKSNNSDMNAPLFKERADVLDSMIVEQGKLKFDSSKIYVDINGLIQSLRDEFERHYNSFISERNISMPLSAVAQVEEALYMMNNADSALIKLIDCFLNEFAKNPNYGLDKALSTELRHGIFSSLIRARFESFNLVTPFNKDTGYADNDYWMSRFDILTDVYLRKLNNCLGTFSRQLDDIIAEANEWFKVTFDQNNGIRVFNFNVKISDLQEYRRSLYSCNDFQMCLAILSDIAWSKLTDCIRELSIRISTTFKDSIDAALESLLNNLSEKIGAGQLKELLDAITSARNDFIQDISTVSEWLTVSRDLEIDPHTIGSLLKIAEESLFQIKLNRNIEFVMTASEQDLSIEMSGKESKALITSLVTAFENAIRYGDSGDKTSINISLSAIDRKFKLTVHNKMLPFKRQSDKQAFFDTISKTMESPLNVKLISQEGGTGLYKIRYLLSRANKTFDAKVCPSHEDSFCLHITGECNENTNC